MASFWRKLGQVSASLLTTAGALGACSNASDDTTTQVLEAKVACRARAQWNPNAPTICADCQAYAQSPACTCPAAHDFGGACETQATKRNLNRDCSVDVNACVSSCDSDCDCVEACFATHASCKDDYAAVTSCLLATCTKYCQ